MNRRAFLGGAAALLACDRAPPPPPLPPVEPIASATNEPAPPPPELDSYPLFERFPKLSAAIPRLSLGRFPSRVEAIAGLPATAVFVKRDDDLSPIVGGGKVRKLELLLADARRLGKTRVITFGGVGSNQAVATALLGRAHGFEVEVRLAPQPPSTLVTRNLEALAASGATMRLVDSVSAAEAEVRREARALDASAPYVIAPGGSGPLGTLAFVNAGLELAEDFRRTGVTPPRVIYVALGLGGTAVGLAIGCALGSLDAEIIAVRASNPTTVVESTVATIRQDTIRFARSFDVSFPDPPIRLRIDGRFTGAGYGTPTREGALAAERARSSAGLELDPVYTSKAFAALIADARDRALFWDTASAGALPRAPVPAPFRRFLPADHT